VSWILLRRFINHQTDISEFSEYNYLYSPNLQMHLDCDNSKGIFQIKSTLKNEVLLEIPQGWLNTKFDKPDQLVKMFRWVSNNEFKVINSDSLEKKFKITKSKKLEQVSYGIVPMFDHTPVKKEEKYHYYFDTLSVLKSPDKIYERLIRKVQLYYSAIYVDGAESAKDKYNVMLTVDFNTQASQKRKVVLDQSFTFLHWRVVEALCDDENKVDIRLMSKDEIKLLALNIFPQGKTAAHYLFNHIDQLKLLY